jgi:hypothetical protein
MPVRHKEYQPYHLPGRRPALVRDRYIPRLEPIANFDEMHLSIIRKFKDDPKLLDLYFKDISLFEKYFNIRRKIALGETGSSDALNESALFANL